MAAIRRMMLRLLADKAGATAIEYGLIAALIVIAMMGALSALGGGAGGMWTNISSDVTDRDCAAGVSSVSGGARRRPPA